MGAKRQSRKLRQNTNVVDLQVYQKKNQVTILPRNKNQETYMLKLLDRKKDIIFGIGPAGTGKTLIAVQVAVKLFKEGRVDKIIVTRPAVSVDEDLGFLPGTLEQKMAPWTRPIFDVLREYFNAREISGMIDEGIVEIAPLAYMRGLTLTDSVVVLDEAQNATPAQIKTFVTRIGSGSKYIVCGDLMQSDIRKENGLEDSIKRFTGIRKVGFSQFDLEDVVRHPIVAHLLERYQDDYELGALSAEETLSMWIEKQTYEEPKISNRFFYKIRN